MEDRLRIPELENEDSSTLTELLEGMSIEEIDSFINSYNNKIDIKNTMLKEENNIEYRDDN
jgi:hypothetical protein